MEAGPARARLSHHRLATTGLGESVSPSLCESLLTPSRRGGIEITQPRALLFRPPNSVGVTKQVMLGFVRRGVRTILEDAGELHRKQLNTIWRTKLHVRYMKLG